MNLSLWIKEKLVVFRDVNVAVIIDELKKLFQEGVGENIEATVSTRSMQSAGALDPV